jgi:serine/threonine protein kinase
MSSLPMVGSELAGYRLHGILGRGGMSVVYEAENPRLGSPVALKVLGEDLTANDAFRTRFLKESRIAASLNHPNVIPIYDVGSHEDLLYIAMRYVSGADLRAVLRAQHFIAPDQALLLLGQAGRALDAAHRRGLVHRDVKPGNILIEPSDEEGERDHVYLTDFGISKHMASRSGLTATGEFMGTIDYIAPEQIKAQPVDSRADIYSLGCVLYECLTGRVPFAKDVDAAVIWAHVEEIPTAPSAVRAELPRAIDEVIGKALAKDPAARYATCREFITAARAALAVPTAAPARTATVVTAIRRPEVPAPSGPGSGPGPMPAGVAASGPSSLAAPHEEPPGGPPPDGPPDTSQTRPRRQWLLAGLGALVLVIAAAGGWLIWHANQSSSPTPTGPTSSSSSSMNKFMDSPLWKALITADLAVRHESKQQASLPMSRCDPHSATVVTCTQPNFAVSTVTFRTYPSLEMLYAAYKHKVAKLGITQYNSGNCLARATTGEVSWNHNFHHPKIYSLEQLTSGMYNSTTKLDPSTQAAGRVACTIKPNGDYQLVWTQNADRLLGTMIGTPHDSAWQWWRYLHHNIPTFSGSQMPMPMPSS